MSTSVEVRTRIEAAIGKTDWELLRQQKDVLQKRIWNKPDDPLWGLINFLDCVQDSAAEDIPEEEVFGPSPPGDDQPIINTAVGVLQRFGLSKSLLHHISKPIVVGKNNIHHANGVALTVDGRPPRRYVTRNGEFIEVANNAARPLDESKVRDKTLIEALIRALSISIESRKRVLATLEETLVRLRNVILTLG